METQRLLQQYKSFLDSHIIERQNIDYTVFEKQLQLLELIARVENSSISVLDFYRREYIFVRNKIGHLIDFDEQKAKELGNLYFFSIMHPDDLPQILETNMKSINFLHTFPVLERKNLKIISEYRLRNKTGGYLRFIQQVAILELDKTGKLWLALMLHDLSPNQTDTKSFQRSLVNIKTNETYHFSTENRSDLSKREVEILGFISKGLMSKEIAEQLFISVNTVNNHRQKIIEKMKVENTNEALIYAKKIGIL